MTKKKCNLRFCIEKNITTVLNIKSLTRNDGFFVCFFFVEQTGQTIVIRGKVDIDG